MAKQTESSWPTRWNAKFADNSFENITEATFREFAADIIQTFPTRQGLTTNMIRGGLYRVSSVAGLSSIPADMLIKGMEALVISATVPNGNLSGVGSEEMSQPDGVYYKLVANSTGNVEAFIDEKPDTKTLVKCVWVRVSGTEVQKILTYPELPTQDQPLKVGEVYRYTYSGGQTRLVQVKVAQNTTYNVLPSEDGEDDDFYIHFAPLGATTPGLTVEQAVAAVLAANGRGLNELVLPQFVEEGKWYSTATGIWEARGDDNANAAPVSGPQWRLVVSFSIYTDTQAARAALDSGFFARFNDARLSLWRAGTAPYAVAGPFGYASAFAALALGRGVYATQPHAFAVGFQGRADTNCATATGYRTWAKPPAAGDAENTHGQYAGGAGRTFFNAPEVGEGTGAIIAQGYAAFNHSNNDGNQPNGHGARANRSAILGGLNADVAPDATGTVLLGSNATKVPATFSIGGVAEGFTYRVAAQEYVAMQPGLGYVLRSPNGEYHRISVSDAGGLLVNGVSVGGGGSAGNGVAVASGAAISLTTNAEYAPITSGTFTTDLTGAVVGTVVTVYLAADNTTEPSLSPSNFQKLSGTYVAGKELMYMFKVGGNGKIQYTITELE